MKLSTHNIWYPTQNYDPQIQQLVTERAAFFARVEDGEQVFYTIPRDMEDSRSHRHTSFVTERSSFIAGKTSGSEASPRGLP